MKTYPLHSHANKAADLGPGPWQDEPDKATWIDTATDLDCMIVRSHSGALCGYVGVPPGHCLHGKDYSLCGRAEPCGDDYCDHSAGSRVEVHGGITYAATCSGNICHEPESGRPNDVWWFGFDCGHCDDLIPNRAFHFTRGRTYRTFEYVRGECSRLAEQLHGFDPN
jgi:hypothetical protein